MSTPCDPGPSLEDDLLAAFESAIEQLHDIFLAADRLDEKIERLDAHLRTSSGEFARRNYTRPPSLPRSGESPNAQRLHISRQPNGAAVVQLDTLKPFRLSCGLADFLDYLAGDDGSSSDLLVPWKPRDAVRAWLQRQSGKPLRRAYVNKRVSDLRSAIRAAGVTRQLVLSHYKRGVRLALLRQRSRLFLKSPAVPINGIRR